MNESSKILRVLITGAGGPAGVNALRLLSRQSGVEAYATDADELSVGRSFAKDFRTISYMKDRERYARDLRSMIHDWSIDVVVPTVAEELIVIRDAMQGLNGAILVSDQETLEVCHDKAKLYAHLSQHLPEHLVQWQYADEPVRFDADEYFLKPRVGRGARGCRVISRAEREALIGQSEANEQIVMEVLPGMEWTVDAYIAEDGSIPMLVPRERLALSGGICVKGRTVNHPDVIAASRRVLEAISFRGPMCIQWKADRMGQPKLVEINPRLSGGAMITAAAGADPMECLIEELRSGSVSTKVWKEVTVLRHLDEKIL